MNIPKDKLKKLESEFKNGSAQLDRKWKGFDPRKNTMCIDDQSMQRSILLSYCRLLGENADLSNKNAIEIGVEKHRHVCMNLGLQDWKRLDRLDDVGGNTIDYKFDFVSEPTPIELNNYFEVVVCCNTLEHTFDIFKGFDGVFNLAAEGSLLYFSTPFSIGIHGLQDYWRLTPDCYRKILEKYTDNYVVLEEAWKDTLYGVSAFAIK